MTEPIYRHIPESEVPGKPLGRHVLHDPRSRDFAVQPQTTGLRTVTHRRYTGPLNQQNYGACTGFATTGLLATAPFWGPLKANRKAGLKLDDNEGMVLYALATQMDTFPGTFTYPPPGGQDTGSNGLSVCKGAQKLGLISGYQHAFSLEAMQTALQTKPAIVGVNWYDSMDNPDVTGRIRISPNAGIRGGHEFEVNAINVTQRLFGCWQSWGDWGIGGKFYISWDDMGRLLSEQGDCTVPTPLGATPGFLARLRHLI